MVKINKIINWLHENNFDVIVQKKYDENLKIEKPETHIFSKKNNISFTKNEIDSDSGIVFCNKNIECKSCLVKVVTENPRLDFIKCITIFFPPKPCKIIKGKNVKIGKNCSIGSDGFGYEKDHDGSWIKFPHYGNIIFEDNVEIGDNNTIARGTLGDTIIREGVKTDGGVHIAHNSEIGKNTLLTAHVMIAGGVKIGENCWLGPSSSIINKITIGDNVFVGIGSNVIKNIPNNVIIAGNPAKILRSNEK